jgi:hypothetical protein
MPGRFLALACLLLLAPPLSGCWVIDEIDSGSKWMDDHSPKGAKAETDEADAEAAVNSKKSISLDAYFTDQDKKGATKTFTPGQVSEGIVACKLGGSTQFMTRDACAARGGRS